MACARPEGRARGHVHMSSVTFFAGVGVHLGKPGCIRPFPGRDELLELADRRRSPGPLAFGLPGLEAPAAGPPGAAEGALGKLALGSIGADADLAGPLHGCTLFWLSMHCLATARGAPPTAETKWLLVQGAGMRALGQGDSALRPWLALPLMRLTALWIPSWGSTSKSMWTWPGMASISMMSKESLPATCSAICRKRPSTPSTSTGLRHFGQKTTWYLQLQTTLPLLLHSMRASCRLQIAIA